MSFKYPGRITEWFADKVDERMAYSVFLEWHNGQSRTARKELDKSIRFHWTHSAKDEYFEFYIDRSEVTNQTILIVKDFAGIKEDIKTRASYGNTR